MSLLSYTFGLRKVPFVRDVLTVQSGSFLFMGAGFLASIAFARFLGKDLFGTYAVVMAFAGTATAFFNIGQGQSLYVFFAEAFGKKDRRAMSAVIANFLMVAAVNVLLLGLLAFVMPTLSDALYGSPEIGKLARIYCLFQISEIGNSFTLILLQSIRRIRLKVILEQSANLSYLALAVLALVFHAKVRGILLIQLSVSVFVLPVSLLVLASIARKEGLPGIREILRIPFRESNQYLVQGLIITVEKTIGNFFPQGLFFVASLFLPASKMGMIRIASQMTNITRSVVLPQAGDLSTAAFGRMKAEGVMVMRRNAAKLIKHAVAFHALVSLAAAAVFPFVVYYAYGASYLDAIPLVLILLPLSLPVSLCIANSPLLRLYRKTPYSITQAVFSWILMLGTVWIGGVTGHPLAGFVIAYGIGMTMPLMMTAYIFLSLLRPEPTSHTAS